MFTLNVYIVEVASALAFSAAACSVNQKFPQSCLKPSQKLSGNFKIFNFNYFPHFCNYSKLLAHWKYTTKKLYNVQKVLLNCNSIQKMDFIQKFWTITRTIWLVSNGYYPLNTKASLVLVIKDSSLRNGHWPVRPTNGCTSGYLLVFSHTTGTKARCQWKLFSVHTWICCVSQRHCLWLFFCLRLTNSSFQKPTIFNRVNKPSV